MKRIVGTAVGLFILGAALLLMPTRGEAGPILKGEPVGTHVNCGGSTTIGAALGRAQPLRVHGTCGETISIADTRANITILGDGGGDNRSPDDRGSGVSACNDSNNTQIVGDDPTAAQIIQVRGRNITITGVEISGIRGDDPSVKPKLGANVWDSSLCPGGATAQDPNCNNNRGVRAQRGGIVLLGRNVAKGDFGGGIDPKTYIEQTGICIHDVSKNGIEGNAGTVVRIINSEIKNVGGDGISLTDLTAANIGSSSGSELNLPSDAFQAPGHAGPNIIHHNTGGGITVDRGSQARIVGNYIHNNGADGVRVRRHSQADLASTLINANGQAAASAGVRVDDNSNISLGTTFHTQCFATSFGFLCPTPTAVHTGTFIKQDALANTVSVPNIGFGIRCTVGGSISGKASTDRGGGGLSLLKNGGGAGTSTFGSVGATGTEDNCINKTN